MILTDREIQIALEHGSIIIDPRPDAAAYSSTSVDLTLDKALSEFRDLPGGVQTVIDPGAKDFNHEQAMSEFLTRISIDPADGYVFQPGKLLLAWSQEYVKLEPHARIAARVEGKRT